MSFHITVIIDDNDEPDPVVVEEDLEEEELMSVWSIDSGIWEGQYDDKPEPVTKSEEEELMSDCSINSGIWERLDDDDEPEQPVMGESLEEEFTWSIDSDIWEEEDSWRITSENWDDLYDGGIEEVIGHPPNTTNRIMSLLPF